jgi:hypothetical protein
MINIMIATFSYHFQNDCGAHPTFELADIGDYFLGVKQSEREAAPPPSYVFLLW